MAIDHKYFEIRKHFERKLFKIMIKSFGRDCDPSIGSSDQSHDFSEACFLLRFLCELPIS